MALIMSILSIILFAFLFSKILFPLIFKLVDLFSNNLIKNVIIFIGFGIMTVFIFCVPILIIKYYPKTKEEIIQKKYTKFITEAIDNKIKGNYELSFSNYDSAEKYSNKYLPFLFEKSVLKYQSGDSKKAIEIITRLIDSEEKINNYDSHSYEYRSMYYFSTYNYDKSIFDLKKALILDSLYYTEWSTQISMLYLLTNNIDSSFSYLIKSENSILTQNEDDREEYTRELNLLKALIYLRKNDKLSACSYFQQYKNLKGSDIYFNYSLDLIDRRFKNYEEMYSNLFTDEFSQLSMLCNLNLGNN
jgi:hypothetical protein